MGTLAKASPGDVFTLANGALGFLAITYILDRSFLVATALLLLSMMMDGLDGLMARRFGSKHTMGQVLDSISDSISFAIAPAALIYAEFHDPDQGVVFESLDSVLALACAIAVLSAGLFRLARFSAGGYKLRHFVGMPAPAAALLILLICLLFGTTEGTEPSRYYFSLGQEPWVVFPTALASSYLMVSGLRYPKMRGWMNAMAGIALLLALLPITAGLALVGDQDLYTASSRTAASAALALMLLYVLGGPVYEKLEGDESR